MSASDCLGLKLHLFLNVYYFSVACIANERDRLAPLPWITKDRIVLIESLTVVEVWIDHCLRPGRESGY